MFLLSKMTPESRHKVRDCKARKIFVRKKDEYFVRTDEENNQAQLIGFENSKNIADSTAKNTNTLN